MLEGYYLVDGVEDDVVYYDGLDWYRVDQVYIDPLDLSGADTLTRLERGATFGSDDIR